MFASTNCQATRSFFFQWSMNFGMQTHQQNQRVSWTKNEVFVLPKQKWQRADERDEGLPDRILRIWNISRMGSSMNKNDATWIVVVSPAQPEFRRQFSCWKPRVPGNDRKTCWAETLHMGVSKNRVFTQYEWFISWKPLLEWMIWGENPLFSATPYDNKLIPRHNPIEQWNFPWPRRCPGWWKWSLAGKFVIFLFPNGMGFFSPQKSLKCFFLLTRPQLKKNYQKDAI